MTANDLRQMRQDHRRPVDDAVATAFELRAEMLGDPRRGQAEHGLEGRLARDGVVGVRRQHQHAPRRREATTDLHTVHPDGVGRHGQRQVVTGPDQRCDEPQFERHVAPQRLDALEQAGASGLDEIQQVRGELELEGLDTHL